MLKMRLICKGSEPKIVRCFEKFGRNFDFPYSIKNNQNHLEIEFNVKVLQARNELIRRLRHTKNFQLINIQTQKVKSDG